MKTHSLLNNLLKAKYSETKDKDAETTRQREYNGGNIAYLVEEVKVQEDVPLWKMNV